MSRLQKKYKEEIVPELKKRHAERNVMELPALKKIVISMGLGEAIKDKNAIQEHSDELTLLSGQKPVVTKSKNAISNFKLREDQPIGLVVTLRGKRMYDFMDRFCHIVSPRIRDFRGFGKKCDGRGNYNFGLSDQQVFPEINLDKVKRAQGMNIVLVTSAKNDEDCVELLTLLGFPFKS
jgi:large subunit ribosomal protein L5